MSDSVFRCCRCNETRPGGPFASYNYGPICRSCALAITFDETGAFRKPSEPAEAAEKCATE